MSALTDPPALTPRRRPSRTRPPRPEPAPPPGWTLFSNHAFVLLALAAAPDARIREIAQQVDLTERAVQNILGDLVDARLVRRRRVGRRNRYELHLDQPLLGPFALGGSVAALVELAAGARREPARARSL